MGVSGCMVGCMGIWVGEY